MQGRLSKLMYLLLGVFAAGAGLATLIVILFTPFSGKETRRRIVDFTGNLLTRQRALLQKEAEMIKKRSKKQGWLERLVA